MVVGSSTLQGLAKSVPSAQGHFLRWFSMHRYESWPSIEKGLLDPRVLAKLPVVPMEASFLLLPPTTWVVLSSVGHHLGHSVLGLAPAQQHVSVGVDCGENCGQNVFRSRRKERASPRCARAGGGQSGSSKQTPCHRSRIDRAFLHGVTCGGAPARPQC